VSELPMAITLGPEEEATRLWVGALAAFDKATTELVPLYESLDLGVRAAEIAVIHKLQPVKDRFPATIALQLELPVPEIDATRDAVTVPKALDFTEILDLLSDEGLECVGPRLHRGWEDRRFSCRRSRRTAKDAVGFSLDAADRDQLLLLAAYRNRLFRYPPPIRIVPAEIRAAFPVLRRVVEALL
jgi:hypothetical protein